LRYYRYGKGWEDAASKTAFSLTSTQPLTDDLDASSLNDTIPGDGANVPDSDALDKDATNTGTDEAGLVQMGRSASPSSAAFGGGFLGEAANIDYEGMYPFFLILKILAMYCCDAMNNVTYQLR
jgi:hypothetical protein